MTRSLSARLLIFIIFFVMVAEIFIFVPSVARFRYDYFREKLATAHLALLTLDATPDGMVSESLESELLNHVGAFSIAVKRGEARLVLMNDSPPNIKTSYDLGRGSSLSLIRDALLTLAKRDPQIIRLVGASPQNPAISIEMVIDETPLVDAMVAFATRIFLLSLTISLVTATLVYGVLLFTFVRPMKRLTDNMIQFRENPDDGRRVITPSDRPDEIGRAEQELAQMQETIRRTLHQQEHLAAMGTAVAKINHDLRGILSSALLVSDRLDHSDDPEVRRITPILVRSIDRAVQMCSQTLDYAGQAQPLPNRQQWPLRQLLQEASVTMTDASLANQDPAQLDITFDDQITVQVDRDQILRALGNLLRNAYQAGAGCVTASIYQPAATQTPDGSGNNPWMVQLLLQDDGPGLPPKARDNLFKPFKASARAGGTGLGLVIARELLRNNGGELTLTASTAEGTSFLLNLPTS